MYCWKSKALSDYGPGHIIVAADNVDLARSTALEEYTKQVGDVIHWNDPDYRADLIKVFEADLATDPIECQVLLISGSA